MIRKLQQLFALTEKGARDMWKGIWLTALANLTLMAPAGLLLMVIQKMLSALQEGNSPSAGVWAYTALAALLTALIYLAHWVQYGCTYTSTYEESANRRIRLAEKLRQLPLSFFGRRDLADLTNTILSDCNSLEQTSSHYLPQLFGSMISIALVAVCLLVTDWQMALALLWVLPVALLMTVGSKRVQDSWGGRSIDAKRAAADGIQECLENIRDIKACNRKERYLAALFSKLEKAEKAAIHSELATGVFVSGAQMFLKLGLATVVLAGALRLAAGTLTLPTYLIFLLCASRLYDPLSGVMMNIAAVFNAKLQIERMRAIEEQPVQTGADECRPAGYDIVFDQVKFAYNEDEGVLDGVSFTARQGQVTALVGPSGGGKSTAAKLAARFWDVDGGRITLGGVDVASVEPEALLRHYAIVFQDVVLFRDTVMENIRLGRREATDAEVLAAARAAQCEGFIQKLPQGYQTVIGENGSTLSGGERQRISIARALLKDAPVILLDEATASLDVENESAVQAALSHLVRDKTVLIIAHRMRTVASADHIVVLQDGRVAEQGTPAELARRRGPYRRMVELQRQSASWELNSAEA